MSIKLVVTDLDGCLTAGRGMPVDLQVFGELNKLRNYIAQDLNTPWLAVITARPQPYLEAILQLIDGETFGIFEWGCGLFKPISYNISFFPGLNASLRESITICKAKLSRYIEGNGIGFVQPGKEVAVTVYPFNKTSEALEKLYDIVMNWLSLQELLKDKLRIYKTHTFINLLPMDINKKTGLEWMLKEVGVLPEYCLGIGDGQDDLPFLKECGFSAAPANAAPILKNEVDYWSNYKYGHGILDCIRHFIEENR
ncbi:MAG: hypothetical protein QG657_5532 [Acidobacteriota bacterium]|nr:hypothetical protein [Acidobacteriota bacterium]